MSELAGKLFERVKESFDRQAFMGHLGAELLAVEEGKVSVGLDFNPALTQQAGVYHAGVYTTIADSASGYAALTMMPEGKDVLSVEFKINLLRATKSDRLVANAWVVKAGRQIVVTESEVVDQEGRLIAKFQGTMIVTDNK